MPILLHSCPAARTPSSSVLESFTSVNRWVTLQRNMLALGPRGGVTESSQMLLLHSLCAIISIVGPQYKKRYIKQIYDYILLSAGWEAEGTSPEA